MTDPVVRAPGNPRGSLRLSIRQDAPIRLDASLECAPGQMLAVVGPSGSGKTTLLRSIAGLHQPRAGTVTCGGEIWLDSARGIHVPTQARRVGMVFQDYGLFPHLCALDNIALAVGGGLNAESRRRAQSLLDLVHMAQLGNRRPAQLSGGQQQRVALARALARGPSVLLLDEPFAAVDRRTRARLVQELAQLRRQLDMPVILVTHDLDEARVLADRLCVLDHGATLQTDNPEAIIARPQSARVARLLGMENVFSARVAAHLPDRGVTLLDWNGICIEAALRPEIPPGMPVEWLLHPEHAMVRPVDAPLPGDGNRLVGEIEECLPMGGNWSLTIRLSPTGASAALPARGPGIAYRRGDPVVLDIAAAAVHVMDNSSAE